MGAGLSFRHRAGRIPQDTVARSKGIASIGSRQFSSHRINPRNGQAQGRRYGEGGAVHATAREENV